MGTCKLKIFDMKKDVIIYTCDEVFSQEKQWKEDFRKNNRTDEKIRINGKDEMYNKFCEQINKFLFNCKCINALNPEEGFVARNIRMAKERRDNGEPNPWDNHTAEGQQGASNVSVQPERSKREDFKSYDDYNLDCRCNVGPGFFDRGILEKLSIAYEQSAIAGMVLIQPYLDFTDNPISRNENCNLDHNNLIP